ncbi:TolC family protein [Paraflavisolibacter sp. H34]|uniref:TolC family protein n=1 Tax=Huijunlia imazamoxiresistens TaxID=3127457 RepID=UPI003018A1F0
MKKIFTTMLLFVLARAGAQQRVLTPQEFLQIVKTYHPVARQAALRVDMAAADMVSARAGFDPVARYSNDRKELDNTLYYHQQVSEIRIPTWYGLDVQAGMERLDGSRTHPSDTKGASAYLGFSMPVVKDLLMDKRRAALKQARIFREFSEEEQKAVVNNLLLEACKAYWAWWEQHQVAALFTTALQNAEQRLRLVKTAWALGDRPAIDTVEALTQLQVFRMRQNEVETGVANARLELGVYLWQAGEAPYDLPEAAVPRAVPFPAAAPDLALLLATADRHPELEQYKYKLEGLQVERKLKFQSLLPSVYVKYNQLGKGSSLSTLTKAAQSPWLESNYRYGLSVSLPLRLSEGRGEYRKAGIKLVLARLEQQNKRAGIHNKVKQYHNEWLQLLRQHRLQEEGIALYATLLRGEELKFRNGESSLFLLNAREQKLLEAEQKRIELQAKSGKVLAGLYAAAGAWPDTEW